MHVYEEVKHEISGTVIGTKFANFLDTQEFKLLVWFRYIDDVFFILIHGKEKLKKFLKRFQ